MNRLLFVSAFLLGAAAVIWMSSTFVGSDQLALAVTLVIGCVYTIGFVELVQFRQATSTLTNALLAIPGERTQDIAALDQWLARLDPSLQNSVRLRIEGERVGLPAPVITPYLVGLLVMLGLLGTFVGMVDTLRGAVFALEGTTELQAIREGLAAPINGLSLAFGTSVAGVAASAMLGLISTLSRRDRILATRQLDTKVTTVFRDFSLTHNRQETYRALQSQAEALPDVARKLEAMADKLERMGDTLGDKLIANQEALHQSVTGTYTDLASSVDSSMKQSLAESGHLAEKLIANQDTFHQSVTGTYRELASSVDSSLKESLAESGRLAGESIKPLLTETMAGISKEAENTHLQLTLTTEKQLSELGSQFEHLGASMLESFAENSSGWLAKQQAADEQRLTEQQAGDQERLSHWTNALGQAQEQALGQLVEVSKTFSGELQQLAGLQKDAFNHATTDFETMSNTLRTQWLDSAERMGELTTALTGQLGTLRADEEQRGQAALERMGELTTTLAGQLSTLRTDEEQRGQAAVDRLGNLEATVASHLAALGKELEAPMARLIETASETPRAAAEVIGQLRHEISNTLERDNQLLEERRQVMEQLNTLSASLEQSSAGQREAVEQLVSASTGMLQEVGTRFSGQVESELSNMSEVMVNFSGSASEIASLGEAFSLAVTLYNESNAQLIERLEHIEASMDKSSSRSDEQMGYYVAQAREILDQSLLSQREVFEEMQQLGLLEHPTPAEPS